MTDAQITAQCRELEQLLIAKHANYGRSAEERPFLIPGITPGEAVFVRMGDKAARIRALNSGETDRVGESLADTVRDLAGYCILWLIIHDEAGNCAADSEDFKSLIPDRRPGCLDA